MAIFKVYLLRHLWSEVGFDYVLWIYGTISKIHRAGFLNFGFVFDLWEVKGHRKCQFVLSWNDRYSVTNGRRVELLGPLDRATNGLSQTTNRSRPSRGTWPSRDPELSGFASKCQLGRFSKSISSAIYRSKSGLIIHYDSVGQYLKSIGPDFRISVSFSIYGRSKVTENANLY